MKKLLLLFCIPLFFSCEDKDNSENSIPENILKNFFLSVDTLVIDVGEELFHPGSYYLQDFNEDLSKGYFFYPENEIHEIDLNKMELVTRHVFDEDGPDAIPDYLNYMQLLPDAEVFFGNYAQMGVYKITGEKVIGYKMQPENVEGIPNDAGYSLTNSLHISPDKSTILSLPNTFGEPIEGLAVIKGAEMSAKILELPALELSTNFHIVFRQGNGASATGDYQQIQFLNDRFFIYSGATAEIYSYDWKIDSLQLHSFPHQLVPLTKTGDVPKNIDSREAYQAASRDLHKQITYGKFYWDETREAYFRFGDMNWQYSDEGKSVSSDVYLFSYDKDLNLTGETQVDGMKFMPYGSFMKNGKLHMQWVLGENPAFIQYTFNF